MASELIEQVFVNLLENAIHYTRPAARLRFRRRNAATAWRFAWQITAREFGQAANREIFDLFDRGTNVVADGQRGVGLGLTICRSIVRAHGGEITAANRPRGGAEFLITLPCATESPEVTLDELDFLGGILGDVHHNHQPCRSCCLSKMKRRCGSFLRAFLSGAGYRVEDAASGEEGIADWPIDKPPDLVILDLGLPDMDGQDVLRKLREWLTAPIIVLSVRYQDAQKIMALESRSRRLSDEAV